VKIKKYQNGGKDPVLEKMAREQLAADRAVMMDEAMRQNIIPDPRVTGAISVDRPYIFDFMGAGELASLAARGVRALAGRGARSVAPAIDMARREMLEGFAERSADKRALMNLQQKQLNDRLQNIADRALREGAKDESLAVGELQINLENLLRGEIQDFDKLQASLDDILRDIEFTEYLDNKSYQQLVKDIDQVFNEARGGSLSSTPLKDATFDPRTQEPVESFMEQATQPSFKLNKYGGKIKVLKK
tara:strand:- start:3448 stop:4188 length:741 start_codon:yes stop_codon:yes gene_type:complete